MLKLSGLTALLQCLLFVAHSQTTVVKLRCENKYNPVGVTLQHPDLSWELNASGRGVQQSAYEIRLGTGRQGSSVSRSVWNSGKTLSGESVHVPCGTEVLHAATTYYWQVRVWDNQGHASPWSEPTSFQTGLSVASDWKAQWIEPGPRDSGQEQSPLLRKVFSTHKKVLSATAFITAHGLYEAFINGKKVGDGCLTPGWTSYNKRLQYQQYDVTALLQHGDNAIGVMLGNGWYRGPLTWDNHRDIYGKFLGLLFQLQVTYTDGSTETIASDGSWTSATGSVISSEIYTGETIDDRLERKGWNTAGYKDTGWSAVTVAQYGYDNLVSTFNEPIRKHETFKPIKIWTTPKGEQVIDFGQNLVRIV